MIVAAVVVAREAETAAVTTAETTDATIQIQPTSRSSHRLYPTYLTARAATVTVATLRVRVQMTVARDARVATRRKLSLSKSPRISSRLASVPTLRGTCCRVRLQRRRKRMMSMSSKLLKNFFRMVRLRPLKEKLKRSAWKRS